MEDEPRCLEPHSVRSNGIFSTIDVPGGTADNSANTINNRGQIVGQYADSAGVYHGYLLSESVFTAIDFPGAAHSFANGINNRGQIVGNNNNGDFVGRYVTDSNVDRSAAQHAFLLSSSGVMTVDPPGWTGRAIAADVNNRGQIVGLFRDAAGRHGFLAAPVSNR
jgi:hypothetical protein